MFIQYEGIVPHSCLHCGGVMIANTKHRCITGGYTSSERKESAQTVKEIKIPTWTKESKHNWFNINGEIRANKYMTTEEFSKMLREIEDAYGLEFLGSLGYSDTKDEDYE